jgi:lysophospholipase L1-like esterase
VVGAWDLFDHRVNGEWIRFGDPRFAALLHSELTEAVRIFVDRNVSVQLATSPYLFTEQVNRRGKLASAFDPARVDVFNQVVRDVVAAQQVSAQSSVDVLDLNALLCPNPQCSTQMGAPRPDGVHYDENGANLVADWVWAQIADRTIAVRT